jgi:hypothetical protein
MATSCVQQHRGKTANPNKVIANSSLTLVFMNAQPPVGRLNQCPYFFPSTRASYTSRSYQEHLLKTFENVKLN